MLLGKEQDEYWSQIVHAELKKVAPPEAFPKSEERLKGFQVCCARDELDPAVTLDEFGVSQRASRNDGRRSSDHAICPTPDALTHFPFSFPFFLLLLFFHSSRRIRNCALFFFEDNSVVQKFQKDL